MAAVPSTFSLGLVLCPCSGEAMCQVESGSTVRPVRPETEGHFSASCQPETEALCPIAQKQLNLPTVRFLIHRNCEIINAAFFFLEPLGIICSTAIDNKYSLEKTGFISCCVDLISRHLPSFYPRAPFNLS